MSIQLTDLEVELLKDFFKVIKASPLLWEAYFGLPEAERDAVDSMWLRLIWATITAGADEVTKHQRVPSVAADLEIKPGTIVKFVGFPGIVEMAYRVEPNDIMGSYTLIEVKPL